MSWNHTHHHTKNMLLGHDDGNARPGHRAAEGHATTTTGSTQTPQRNPRVRFGEPVHVYNNYYFDNTDIGVACQTNAGCVVEGNYFENVEEPMTIHYAVPRGGCVQQLNVFVGERPAGRGRHRSGPAQFYSYTLDNPADVKVDRHLGRGRGHAALLSLSRGVAAEGLPRPRDCHVVPFRGGSRIRSLDRFRGAPRWTGVGVNP